MRRLLKVASWCGPLGLAGLFVGAVSGSVGVCGDGGWGVVPFLGGFAALLVSLGCLAAWVVLAIKHRWVKARVARQNRDSYADY